MAKAFWDWRISYKTDFYRGMVGPHIEYFCSNCGEAYYPDRQGFPETCPNCKATMSEGTEDERSKTN